MKGLPLNKSTNSNKQYAEFGSVLLWVKECT